MTKIIQILSNLRHNGENFKKDVVVNWEDEATLEQLVKDGVVRVVEGAETAEEAVKLLENEANAEIANAEVIAESAPQDTFAPTGTANTWEAETDEEVTPAAPKTEEVKTDTEEAGKEETTPDAATGEEAETDAPVTKTVVVDDGANL